MISIIITAYKEEKTIGKAIKSITNQKIIEDYEVLCVCPDKETRDVIERYERTNHKIKHVEDSGKGKPTALNIAINNAKGDILILTDGDVFVSDNSINKIIKPFQNKEVGIVSGRPISLNPKENKWGYFSHLLTDLGAHQTRLNQTKKNKMIVCSGYLYAFRKDIIEKIPIDALAEDAVISHMIFERGYKTAYAPNAKVFVKYPDNFKDWIIQKKRSAGGYNQLKFYIRKRERMRSFPKEALSVLRIFSYPKSIKEFFWTIGLIFLRLYLWSLIYKDINLKKKDLKEVWLRVESTK